MLQRLLRNTTAIPLLAMVAVSCGGGGGSSGGLSPTPTPAPTPTPTPTAGCSLLERQNWAAAQLNEWYLFPETLPTGLNPSAYASVQAYIDALTANARAQRRDRFFTYITSIAEENAFYNSGASAGFGIRVSTDTTARRVFIAEAFEGAPALAAGIDRGTEILAIGTTPSSLQTVDSIIASQGADGITNALGPATVGTTRTLRISNAGGTRDVTIAKADYSIDPVSSRYGARIINDGGRQVGYVNLRTFINTADSGLRNAFAQFRAAGVTDVIVDLRYNGGGLVSIAELFGDLLGGGRTGQVFSFTTFRPEKASNNDQHNFTAQPQAIAPTRIAFIGTGGTASASELLINAFIPYLHSNVALIGTNTYGKPVGQIAIDRTACDDRLRVIAFATQNSARQGNYFDGLATTVEASCAASDDVTRPFADPNEASTRAALDFLAGRACTRISTSGATAQSVGTGRRELLSPLAPTTAQREVPGLF